MIRSIIVLESTEYGCTRLTTNARSPACRRSTIVEAAMSTGTHDHSYMSVSNDWEESTQMLTP